MFHNYVLCLGHVDAGKSTLMGHVLYQLGFVNKRTMHKYEQESKKLGKASFAYAWVLDETEEERYVFLKTRNFCANFISNKAEDNATCQSPECPICR